MSTTTHATTTAVEGLDLVVTRHVEATPDKLWRAWTDPVLLKEWFAPLPWTTARVENDVRPGGASLVVMRGPDGVEFPCPGVYLEVVENQRLVFTDAYTSAWVPSAKPFMTGILTFQPEGQGTRYTARVKHWTDADREAHEKMGFHQGWTQCTEQLAALASRL